MTMPSNDLDRIVAGLSDTDRYGIVARNVQAMGGIPWCDCDFRAHGGWAWCETYGDKCLGRQLRARLLAPPRQIEGE